ncbi:hypothetical protein MAP00_008108 [Monascus purpureus]|nr:hypothetical protein MAP00_008108 [Monascus purpureus]
MVATFSPHRDAGGPIHFPSHSAMHVDPSSAIRQLRRSLSRSPSKSSSFFLSSRVHSPAKTTGYISSPLSPSRRSAQGNFVLLPTAAHQSPFAVPYPPSAKIVRPVMRRTRTSPISPMKRVLNVSTDQGNATPCQSVPSPAGEENLPSTPIFGLRGDSSSESTLFNHALACTEPTLAPKPSLPRVEKRRSENFGSSTASPLKRSDGTMNLDQVSRGSPSAKRRSIQLTGHAEEFNVFDNESSAEIVDGPMDPSAMESDLQYAGPAQQFGPASAIPRRSSSLRRSTVQQRQNDRSIFSRSKASGEPPESPTSGTVAFARPRMSHDSNLHQPNNDSPFTSRKTPGGTLFSTNGNNATQGSHAAHPLSRTITQSSSSSSFADDSPTHEPARKNEHPQPMLNFSKSLPVGATRPALAQQLNREDSTSSTDSFATPENYKLAKPLPAAFMSTGLISKKSRNAEDPLGTIAFNKNMPDTPCKRPVNLFPMGSKAQPDQPLQMPRLVRQSCATPASPFNPPTTARPKPGPFARGMGLFEGIFNKPDLSRRASIASLDDDDHAWSQSPSAMRDSQAHTEFDFPPTPTKQAFFPSKTFPPVSSQIASFDRLGSVGANSSPLNDKFQRASPRTPQDHAYSLDPSGLPISGVNNQQSVKPDANAVNLPATPTGPRDSYQQPGKRQSLHLSGYHVPDVDASLTSRFEKVELIGTGEFSQVYRVSQSQDASFSSIFSFSSEPKSPKKLTEQVWAVKKSKQPYSGMKDRERRIREVDILKGLTYSDHIISFFDSWEDNGHLYIQTEFCEEGSLDVFLADVGLKARLDDFRIWKVLLELSLV